MLRNLVSWCMSGLGENQVQVGGPSWPGVSTLKKDEGEGRTVAEGWWWSESLMSRPVEGVCRPVRQEG